MNVLVSRSFSPFRKTGYARWFRHAAEANLSHGVRAPSECLVVILAEAGIGKTFECENKAKNFAADGKTAFFIPLNLLNKPDGFSDEGGRHELSPLVTRTCGAGCCRVLFEHFRFRSIHPVPCRER